MGDGADDMMDRKMDRFVKEAEAELPQKKRNLPDDRCKECGAASDQKHKADCYFAADDDEYSPGMKDAPGIPTADDDYRSGAKFEEVIQPGVSSSLPPIPRDPWCPECGPMIGQLHKPGCGIASGASESANRGDDGDIDSDWQRIVKLTIRATALHACASNPEILKSRSTFGSVADTAQGLADAFLRRIGE